MLLSSNEFGSVWKEDWEKGDDWKKKIFIWIHYFLGKSNRWFASVWLDVLQFSLCLQALTNFSETWWNNCQVLRACWIWSGAEVRISCRAWEMLQNAYFLAKSASIQPRTRLSYSMRMDEIMRSRGAGWQTRSSSRESRVTSSATAPAFRRKNLGTKRNLYSPW